MLALSEPMRPAKSVVFAGVLVLRGDFRGMLALSEPMRPAKSVVFAGVPGGLLAERRAAALQVRSLFRGAVAGECHVAGRKATEAPDDIPVIFGGFDRPLTHLA